MTSDAIRIPLRVFSLPKQGCTPDENEDACAHDAERGLYALADGASESGFARLWADLLVREFVRRPEPQLGPWASWLPALQQRWAQEVEHLDLPWYAEMKVQQGAFATFLGVVVQPPALQAVAVGDSCLFLLRDAALYRKFPVESSADFSLTPWLVGSRRFDESSLAERTKCLRCDWQPGDRLWLMTDALAQWFLQQVEADHRPWEELQPLLQAEEGEAAFASFVARLRESQAIRNDDVTWMAVEVSERNHEIHEIHEK
jgi:hypothetical protein